MLVFFVTLLLLFSFLGNPLQPPTKQNASNNISLTDMKLCSHNCLYLCGCDNTDYLTRPYLLGRVDVNARVPLSTISLSVNGTLSSLGPVYQNVPLSLRTCTVQGSYTACPTYPSYESQTVFRTQLGVFLDANVGPITQGHIYLIGFIANFEDGSSYTATVSVLAS